VINKAAILAELVELSGISKKDEEEFTRAEFAEAAGCLYEVGKRHLERMVQRGILSRRRLPVDGSSCWVYRKVEANDGS